MDLTAFQYDRSFVLDALRHGELDYLEHVSEAAEADLFRHLIRRQIIQRLAETYPSPRKKEEVPVWIYLSSELSLKLHGAQGYHAFPRMLRSGGLIEALGPSLGGRKTRHPETGDVTLSCPGFNDKNDYDRQTPCDQDFLRKLARDTPLDPLHAWFNREVPRCLRSLSLFDPEGLFIGDASYLFVPDNEHYEQSDLLWFDEHHHPVEADQVDLRDKRYQQHRCYKLVSLIHVNRKLDFFFIVAARVVSGRRHECPILYELVEEVAGYVPLGTPPSATSASPRPAAVEKREAQRQRTWAERKAAAASPAANPTAQRGPQTRLGLGRGLLSWSLCPVPLTAVVNRERDEHGQTQDWVLVTTSNAFTATQIRSTYELRSAIEERHRQYKCFWDLTRMHSCAFSLVVNQALFVLLAYTLVQAHLVLRQRQELNRGVWDRTWQLLSPTLEVVAVYYRQRFCLLTLAEFGRILLDIAEPVRGKLRKKLKRIEREQYTLLENTRAP